ncbi:MAG: 8-oxo-dGTP diphosphatase [Crocinitomicaceae bacterium]|jgi:8-oxo-dGTP diphosphatase
MDTPNINLSVDAVVFGYDPKEGISVLLIQRKFDPFKGGWALPGGLVQENESLEKAVERELKEETGVSLDYLEQLYSFGGVNRDPRNRVVSIAYFGLVKKSDFQLYAATDAEDAKWFHWDQLPEVAFDHKIIIDKAIIRLQSKVRYEPIGFELLDEKFAFSELQGVYEQILRQKIDKRNFKKKFIQMDLLIELNEKIIKGKGRPHSLYKFDRKKYQDSKAIGINFTI